MADLQYLAGLTVRCYDVSIRKQLNNSAEYCVIALKSYFFQSIIGVKNAYHLFMRLQQGFGEKTGDLFKDYEPNVYGSGQIYCEVLCPCIVLIHK